MNVQKLILFVLIIISCSAQAATLKCKGLDTNGDTITMLLVSHAGTININGNVEPIAKGSWDEHSETATITTESYELEKGGKAYDEVIAVKNDVTINQHDAKNNKIIATTQMSCYKKK